MTTHSLILKKNRALTTDILAQPDLIARWLPVNFIENLPQNVEPASTFGLHTGSAATCTCIPAIARSKSTALIGDGPDVLLDVDCEVNRDLFARIQAVSVPSRVDQCLL